MRRDEPKASIGLPVRNGEKYVADAIEAVLAQTMGDLELIISDNASTDGTEEIARSYAALDDRVRYQRCATDLGAAPNFNRTFLQSRGEYFRWAAHDDVTHPTHLARCMEILERDPGVVLSHSRVLVVDAWMHPLYQYEYGPNTSSPDPLERVYDLLFVHNNCYDVFGLIRSSVLRQTGLMGAFPVGDRVLLTELALRGRFHEVPEPLFYSRDHQERSVRRHVTQHERASWFDARYEGRLTFPEWRAFAEYVRAMNRAPLRPGQRAAVNAYMLKWVRHYRKRMRSDVYAAARTALSRLSQPPPPPPRTG